MGNCGKIPDIMKHGTNNSQMKWEDYDKESENDLMVRERELNHQTHSLK